MSELEFSKNQVLAQLRKLCAHCAVGRDHACPLSDIALRIQSINGVPLLVNNEFKGVVWTA